MRIVASYSLVRAPVLHTRICVPSSSQCFLDSPSQTLIHEVDRRLSVDFVILIFPKFCVELAILERTHSGPKAILRRQQNG